MSSFRLPPTIVAVSLALALVIGVFSLPPPAYAGKVKGPRDLTGVGSTLFFSHFDGAGRELWASDGTRVGTRRVADIKPGSASSLPSSIVELDGVALFFAGDGVHGRELWRSDGTPSGTQLVKDINPSSRGSQVDSHDLPLAWGSQVFFPADDGTSGPQLWVTDGTEEGTRRLADIRADLLSLGGFAPLGEHLYFIYEGSLWRTDGTEEGTEKVADEFGGRLTSAGGLLFFPWNDGVHGNELWKSDGTQGGTVLVADINPEGKSKPGQLTAVGNRIFFEAFFPGANYELGVSDGTEAGTHLVKDIKRKGTSHIGDLTAFRGELFFRARNRRFGSEVWKSDGTASGTRVLKDISPVTRSVYKDPAYPVEITATGRRLFFSQWHPKYRRELWKSDGTRAGTVLVADIHPRKSSRPRKITAVRNRVFFVARDLRGPGLWRSNGSRRGTIRLLATGG